MSPTFTFDSTHLIRRNVRVLVGLCALATLSACGKADAASKSSVPTNGAVGSAEAPAPTPSLTPSRTQSGSAPSDSMSDSLIIARADHGRLLGRDSGVVWVVMISDFQCPYCKQWHDAVLEDVKRDYVSTGRVRLAYLNLPLQQHKYARAEAEASMCASVQDKFWPYAAGLFQHQGDLEKLSAVQPLLESLARSLSLDMDQFARCQKRQAIRALVESDAQQAGRAGVRSTPSFLIGDFLVEGAVPYPDFRKAIDTALVMAKKAKRAR